MVTMLLMRGLRQQWVWKQQRTVWTAESIIVERGREEGDTNIRNSRGEGDNDFDKRNKEPAATFSK